MPRDPEKDKGNALRFAKRQAERWRKAEGEAHLAMWFASEAGASVRDIEEATGVPYRTVARIVSTTRDEQTQGDTAPDNEDGAAEPT